jgi:hypothetical protein
MQLERGQSCKRGQLMCWKRVPTTENMSGRFVEGVGILHGQVCRRNRDFQMLPSVSDGRRGLTDGRSRYHDERLVAARQKNEIRLLAVVRSDGLSLDH